MAFGFRVLQVQSASESFQRVVIRLLQFQTFCLERGSAFFDFAFQVRLVIANFDDQASMLQGAFHAVVELILLKGFQDVVVGAAANGFECGRNVVDGGHHNDRDFGVKAVQPIKKLDAVHFRHDHVAQDQVRSLLADIVLSGAAIAHCGTTVAARFEHGRYNLANGLFVVHYQDMIGVHGGVSPNKHYTGRHTVFWVPLPSQKIAC